MGFLNTIWTWIYHGSGFLLIYFTLACVVKSLYRTPMKKLKFIEKAIRFYIGYLQSADKKGYLPSVVTSSLKSIVAESDNRQNRMLFKLAVEIAIMQNLMASLNEIDPLSMERLRGECVQEVKRLSGGFTFEDALTWQKG